MALWTLGSAYSDPNGSLEEAVQYAAEIVSPGFLLAALEEYSVTLFFSVSVLAIGRVANWPAAHFPVPILGWALKMTTAQLWLFDSHLLASGHIKTYLIRTLVEGVVALVAMLVLIGLAVVSRSPGRVERLDLFPWLSVLLAVSTVIVDWAFILLVVTPLVD